MSINTVVSGGPVEIVTTQNQFVGPDVVVANADGKIGFYDATPSAKLTVTGARDDGTALASLLDQLELLGLIVDASTAS